MTGLVRPYAPDGVPAGCCTRWTPTTASWIGLRRPTTGRGGGLVGTGRRRGARPQAVVLAEHALRLTPAHAAERHERLPTVAAYLNLAGETQRLTDLLGPAIDGLPPGTARLVPGCC